MTPEEKATPQKALFRVLEITAARLISKEALERIAEEEDQQEVDAFCVEIAEQAIQDASTVTKTMLHLHLQAFVMQRIAEKACQIAERAQAEYEYHCKWAEAERAKGRPENELTWGNCVRETGILRPNPSPESGTTQ